MSASAWPRVGLWGCSSNAGEAAGRRVINRAQGLLGAGKEVTAIKSSKEDLGSTLECILLGGCIRRMWNLHPQVSSTAG